MTWNLPLKPFFYPLPMVERTWVFRNHPIIDYIFVSAYCDLNLRRVRQSTLFHRPPLQMNKQIYAEIKKRQIEGFTLTNHWFFQCLKSLEVGWKNKVYYTHMCRSLELIKTWLILKISAKSGVKQMFYGSVNQIFSRIIMHKIL